MPYRLGWYLQGKVVYLDLIGKISADEYRNAISQVTEASLETGNALHTLADNRHLETWPPLTSLTGISMPEDYGWVIAVGVSNGFLKFITATASQILSLNMKMVADLPEAITVLQRVDPSLRDTSLPASADHVAWFAASSPDLLESVDDIDATLPDY